jgi:hypothetical protein
MLNSQRVCKKRGYFCGYFMIFMGYTINLMGYGLTSFWGEPGDGDGELKSTWDVQMGIELVLGKTCRYHGSESQLFFFAHYFLN